MLTRYKFTMFSLVYKLMLCTVFISFLHVDLWAQDFHLPKNQERQSLNFRLIKNLIIIPVFINNKGPYDFVLDTGVGPLIIIEPSVIDSLNFTKMRKIKVSGLGLDAVDAFVSQNVNVKIGNAEAQYIPTAVLKEDLFNLSGHLGIKIYGLVGFNFFNSFVVDIRYTGNRIIFSKPEAKIKYKGSRIPIIIEKLRPYVYCGIDVPDGNKINAKLLMDTGASHALSMESLNGQVFPLPEPKIKANLGMSLSGQIKGYLRRIKGLSLGGFYFKNVISGFPDDKALKKKVDLNLRNGNLGADLLKKFNIQFNYREGFINVRPNRNFKIPFEHDMAGMVVYLDQKDYKRFLIGEIDENSPADKSGLCTDDEIISVNFTPVDRYTLYDLSELFKSGANKRVILKIYRNKNIIFKVIHLERRI